MNYLTSAFVAVGLLTATALSAQITPVGITGTGPYYNSASLIIDGFTAPQSSITPYNINWWAGADNTYWNGLDTSFTIDLGATFHVTDIAWSVDNNDAYALKTSLDGVTFTPLFSILQSDGEVDAGNPGGMDTMNSFLGNPDYVASMDFAPVDARYLRVAAVGGDNSYAIGEVTAYGTPLGGAVPEPSTYGIFGAAALLGAAFWRRSRRS